MEEDFPLKVGILAAMPEELGNINENLRNIQKCNVGDLEIFSGEYFNKNNKKILITTAWSGWGKVSAARTTTRICSGQVFGKPDLLLFTGVAGSTSSDINQWDIIVPNSLMQHDMDASPIFEKFVIPALNKDKLSPSESLLKLLTSSLKKNKKEGKLKEFGFINEGLIATGDQFISDKKVLLELKNNIPEVSAIEMEGAAFAQVAIQEKINWIVLRVISDNADDGAQEDFISFLKKYEKVSWKLINIFLDNL